MALMMSSKGVINSWNSRRATIGKHGQQPIQELIYGVIIVCLQLWGSHKSLKYITNYVQLKYNTVVPKATRTMKEQVFNLPKTVSMVIKPDEAGIHLWEEQWKEETINAKNTKKGDNPFSYHGAMLANIYYFAGLRSTVPKIESKKNVLELVKLVIEFCCKHDSN